MPSVRSSRCGLVLASVAVLGLGACSGGGSSSSRGSFDSQGVLLSIQFPDPVDVNPEAVDTPPQEAPLVQQIVFEFNASPNPDLVSRDVLRVRDSSGVPVEGSYDVDGRFITFTPMLPRREGREISPGEFDNGGAGLDAGNSYTIQVGPSTFSFIVRVDPALLARFADPTDPTGLLLVFTTTTDPARFFRGLSAGPPALLAADPADGSIGFSPGLYGDPEGLFPARRPLFLEFDGPVHPAPANLDRFLLVDLDDTRAGFPAGLPLGIDVEVLRNEVDGATVQISPSGILPFGHMLSLEHPSSLSGLGALDPDPGPETTVAANFRVADAPTTSVFDVLAEKFEDDGREETDPDQIELGQLFADWDRQGSDVLQASFAFDGSGELGRFVPTAPEDPSEPRTVVLDTSRQTFPLLDGSTPDAPVGFEVVGGVFPFTDIIIPNGIIIDVRGPNPLVLTATGSVRIAGDINAFGRRGTDENAFDSAVTSIPGALGGAGGGRGGEGHPIIYFPPGVISNLNLISPLSGGRGFSAGNTGRLGGNGGQSGILDNPDGAGKYGTDSEIDCSELVSAHNNGFKGPGGGGGSMLAEGDQPNRNGTGNVLPDGVGGYIVRTRESDGNGFKRLARGQPGTTPFGDGNPDNDFFGLRGEFQQPFGGQGGGAGASIIDGYFCGQWCMLDADPFNDALCVSEFGGNPAFADSVGDSRGGSGGGGGGVVVIKALGPILMLGRGNINCAGGGGGGGEALGCGNWAGSAGGGSGGAIIFQSATEIDIRNNATLDVAGGPPGLATRETNYNGGACPGTRVDDAPGAGGAGGHGIIQLQVPGGDAALVDGGANLTPGAWVDQDNSLNPAEFGSISVGISEWYDMGRTVDRPPSGTNPIYRFRGLEPDGTVPTDDDGFVLDPQNLDVRCDYLGQLDPINPGRYLPGQEPRSNFIPPNASVQLSFQGADAIAPGSKEIDSGTITPWSSDPADASRRQFFRYRVIFDIAADGAPVGPLTPLPAVQSLSVQAEF